MRKWMITLIGVIMLVFSFSSIGLVDERNDFNTPAAISDIDIKPLDLPFEH